MCFNAIVDIIHSSLCEILQTFIEIASRYSHSDLYHSTLSVSHFPLFLSSVHSFIRFQLEHLGYGFSRPEEFLLRYLPVLVEVALAKGRLDLGLDLGLVQGTALKAVLGTGDAAK